MMNDRFPCDALVLAAGRGTRFGGAVPKQLLPLLGKTVVAHSTAAFVDHPAVRRVVVVAPPDDQGETEHALGALAACVVVVRGGDTRQKSAERGLDALGDLGPRDAVLIHDGARPFVSRPVIDRVVAALESADAVIPALPVSDTLKRVQGASVEATVPRDRLVSAQTPQGFRTRHLRDAHSASAALGHGVTDDAGVMEAAGHHVVWVDGHRTNIKITTPDDWPAPTEPSAATVRPVLVPSVGQGFDVHRIAPGGPMTLGGITIDTPHHLVGHSDADVALHAIADALLGAIADGDIGHHFPPSDETWRGAASDQFLAFAAERVSARGRIQHIDLTLICERPKIGPHRDAMRQRIAEICRVDVRKVAVKATTTERLGFAGRGEGVSALALATVLTLDDHDV